MQQKINFVEFLPQQKKVLLSVNLLVKVCLLFLVGLIVAYALSYWQVSRLTTALVHLQARETSTSSKVMLLANKLLKSTDDERLKKQIIHLKSVVEGQEKVISLLRSDELVAKQGFSPLMQSLAETILPGVWLKDINIESGGKMIYLTGFGTTGQMVLSQLNKFNQAENFKGWRFKLSKMHQVQQIIKDKTESVTAFIFRGTYE